MLVYSLVIIDTESEIYKEKILDISSDLEYLSDRESNYDDNICGLCEIKDFSVIFDCMMEYISKILTMHIRCHNKDFLIWFIFNNWHMLFIEFPLIQSNELFTAEKQREHRIIAMYDRQYSDYLLQVEY